MLLRTKVLSWIAKGQQ